jgi:hypothetical protein
MLQPIQIVLFLLFGKKKREKRVGGIRLSERRPWGTRE